MPEIVTLSASETKPSNAHYAIDFITFSLTQSTITVHLVGDNGEIRDAIYGPSTTPTGASLLSTLNTSNNSTGTSLMKRVLNRLLTDGIVVGSVTGSPL